MKSPSIKALLKKYGIQPKKRLGQNFLAEGPTMKKIVDALGVGRDDTVLEIGCGMGIMTAMLAGKCKRVFAVDADGKALDIAREEFGGIGNIEWIHGDILKTDISFHAKQGKLLVVGNIPYNISSPIFFHLLDNRAHVKRAVLMIQKEVAERIVAKPGGKDYGALSIMMRSYAKCEKLFNVAPTNFVPPPKVMSSVIELDFACHPEAKPKDLAFDVLRSVVQAAFQKRRKTVKNALGKYDGIEKILADLGIDPKRRPETLSVEEFHKLAQKIR
jgi:16S rRNA (adenine1518-N6/adenine1519-N6)-dimethyltransferase